MLAKFYILWKRHPITISIILSLLIHIFTLLSLGEWEYLFTWMPDNTSVMAEQEPLSFDLVDNPNASLNEPPPERANLYSDRNSRARGRIKTDLPEGPIPYNEGNSNIPEFKTPGAGGGGQSVPPSSPEQQANQQREQDQKAQSRTKIDKSSEQQARQKTENEIEVKKEEIAVDKGAAVMPETVPEQSFSPNQKFSREYLMPGNNASQAGGDAFNGMAYDNRQFDAREVGDFTLNTYAWDFAPYLLALKRRIQRNIFPPPAFTILGIIEGEFVLQFGIIPDGRLEFLRILDSNGHPSLELTSRKSVELSAPFPPLPANFPEKKLIITGKFTFSVYHEAARARRRGY